MRNLVAGLFISVDGVTESPDQWQKTFDEDMGEALNAQIADVDTILLGRVTYDEWSSYWPTSDDPFGAFINNTPKFVASSTLKEVSWGDFDTVSLLGGNLAEAITELKQQPGNDISVAGSSTLVHFLLQNDLLDELMLMIHPVVVGKGKRLFKDGSDMKHLQVVSSKASRTGTLIVTYKPIRND
jgi:dihydrofolate reductase